MKKINILITSVNGLTGQTISKHFSKEKSYNLIGIDSGEYIISRIWLRKFYTCPKTDDKFYKIFLNELIEKEEIDIIIPTTDLDISFFSINSENGYYENANILVVKYNTYKLFFDKEKTYKFLSSVGIKTPKIYKESDLVFPAILKPISGTGSKNVVKLNNFFDYEYWSKKIVSHIICEYLDGSEYTCDAIFSREFKCLGYNLRQRLVYNTGSATVSVNADKEIIKDVIDTLESKVELVGPINFQFKLDKKTKPIIFDFNTRMPSGGLSLTIKSGLDIPRMIVDINSGYDSNKDLIHRKYPKLSVIKYYEDYFF